MKKLSFVLAILLVGTTMTFAQMQVDTLYYDADKLGVDHPSFAAYYKITMTSNNPYAPNRYRDFSMDGRLIAEGYFLSIDKNSDAYSVYDGQCYDYRDSKMGFLYKDGDMIKFTAYDFNNPEILRYEINLKNGTPNGYENEYDETGNLVTSYLHDMGYKIKETLSGTTWTYKPHGNSTTLKVSTAPKAKTIRELYKDHNITKPKLTNCQEVFLYNDSDKDMLIGLRNIHAVHCTADGLYIFPMNCAWDGNVIKKVAYNKIKSDLKNAASKIKSQATQNATVVTKTTSATRGTNYTHYNDGKYGTVGSGWRDSQDFFKNSSYSSTTSTSKTVDKALEHQLLKEGEEQYNAIVEERWNNYEKFQELIVDSIYLPAGEYITKVIGFQTHFWYEYTSKDYKKFAECMNPIFLGEHKIFITYDIVDLNTDTIILSVSDMYDATDKNAMSDYTKSKSNVFIDFYYAGYNTKLSFEQSDLYYSDRFDFSKWSVKEDKKESKKNPHQAELKIKRHNERIAWIYNRIKATLGS